MRQSLGLSAAKRDPLISEPDQSYEKRHLKLQQREASAGEWYVFAANLAALAIVFPAIAANMRIPIRITSPDSTVSTVSAPTVSTSN